MADTIARLRALWMKFVFITRSFSLTNLIHTNIGSGPFDCLHLLCAMKGSP